MTNINLSYPDLWMFYRQTDQQTQENILAQLNLAELLPTVTIKLRKEILSEAPAEIVEQFDMQQKSSDDLLQDIIGITSRFGRVRRTR